MDRWARLYALAARQHNVVHLRQAADVQLELRPVRRRAEREEWEQLQRMVYALPGSVATYERRVRAAQLAVRGPAAASHSSAAHLWGMIDEPPEPVELLVASDRWAPALDGALVRRSRTITSRDCLVTRRLAVTSPARTACDLAAVLSVDALRTVLIDGVQRRRVRLDEIARRAARLPNLQGRQRLRQVLAELRDEQSDSEFEFRARRKLALEAGLPPPDPAPVPVRLREGRVVHVDVGWSRRKVGIECQSRAFHSDPRTQDLDDRKRHGLEQGGLDDPVPALPAVRPGLARVRGRTSAGAGPPARRCGGDPGGRWSWDYTTRRASPQKTSRAHSTAST